MRIVSLNIGQVSTLDHGGKPVPSAFAKQPVLDRLELTLEGFVGDHQADRKNHGGPDKAVCVFAKEHYDRFSRLVGSPLGAAAFGENLTTSGLLESEVCVGDVYTVGSATVQVSQPRQPCYKMGARHGEPSLSDWVRDSRLTGFYFRVLNPGGVQVGDEFNLVSHGTISIARANELMYGELDAEGIELLLSEPALSSAWQRTLRTKLARDA